MPWSIRFGLLSILIVFANYFVFDAQLSPYGLSSELIRFLYFISILIGIIVFTIWWIISVRQNHEE